MSVARALLCALTAAANPLAGAQDAGLHPGRVQAHGAPVQGVWCFDAVRSGDAIHVLTGDVRTGKASLWYSRSHDGGYRWGRSYRVDAGFPAPQPSMSADHARLGAYEDRLHAVWSTGAANASPALAVSSDAGLTWRAASNSPDEGLGARRAGAAVPGRETGSLHALLLTTLEGAAGLYYRASADAGKTWRQAVKLAGANARNPDLVRAPDGMLAAVWEEATGPESTIFYALSLDDGKSWGTRTKLSDGGSEATHPRVVVTKEGYLALWLERWNNSERVLQRSHIDVRHRH